MAGLRGAIAAGRLAEFTAEFYEKRGQQASPVYNTLFS
jgi:queuine/archaeosine tRNA-ribosyltransferase